MTLTLENTSWLDGVEYDEVTRRHRVDGQPVPSVTQAIDLAHPGRFDHVPPAVLARKAAIGTAVHRAAHYHAEGDLLDASVDAEIRPRVDALKWFYDTRRVDPLLREAVICSRDLGLAPHRRRPYIGKLDLLCRVDRCWHVLLDWKTGVPALARQQTMAYLDALYQQYPQLIAIDIQRWAVVLTAAGTYQIHTFRDDAADALAWRQTLETAYTALGFQYRLQP